MFLSFSDANHIEVLALSVIQRRVLKVGISFVPAPRLQKPANIGILEDAAVFAEDDATNQLQIVDLERIDISVSNALAAKIKRLPFVDSRVSVLGGCRK